MNIEYKSQYQQDYLILNRIFPNMTYGFFVDIGAGDGICISNTYTMEKFYNWSGICIEPCNNSYNELIKNRNCKTSNLLVSDHNGQNDFYEITSNGYYDSYFSSVTLPPEKYKEYNFGKKQCDTLYNILDNLRAPTLIHYLSIDTEGSEFKILKKFFEDEYISDKKTWKRRILTLSVEHNFNLEYRSEINDLMKFYLYERIGECGPDDIYIHQLYRGLAYK